MKAGKTIWAALCFVTPMLWAVMAFAQQNSGGAPKQTPTVVAPAQSTALTAGATSTANTAASSSESASKVSAERERILLDRIEKLEQRLAELESRVTADAAAPASRAVAFKDSSEAEANAIKSPPNMTKPDAPTPPTSGAPAAANVEDRDSSTWRQNPPSTSGTRKPEPFSFADFTWLTGNPRTKESPIETRVFTGEVRFDSAFHYSFNRPKDNTIGGSSEVFRSGELQLTQLGIGGDFHWNNVRGRLLTQIGMYSQTQPRNDPSPARGQWGLDNAYRYISEGYGGYHLDKMNGINIDAGIFMSYIGLWSFYNFDNWSYQPSYVSSNTPWFFEGVRVQIFPSDKLKIEPWLVNGWQSYGRFNKAPGVGGQVLWRPNGSVSLVLNNYWGIDTLGNEHRKRIHTDDSIQVKYLDRPEKALNKAAFSFTFDAGCEYGDKSGVSCLNDSPDKPSQYFLGFMAYNRFWFHNDKFGLTLGGGAITNPGRYLVLVPPINGATASSGTPYFTANPGDKYRAWDASVTFDYMPAQFSTFRFEYNHRASNVPYFSGKGGVTPPGGNTGAPGSFVPGFAPDLLKYERRFTIALLVKL